MRILFVLKQAGYLRHFSSVVTALAERGHTVRLACQDGEQGLPPGLASHANISATVCRRKRGDEWTEYASLIRRSADYLRYLAPAFAPARKLRQRAFDKLVQTLSNGAREVKPGWADVALGLTPEEQDRLRRLHAMVEELVPPDGGILQFLTEEQPDLVLVTPLIDIGSGQAEYVKASRALGIPAGMILFSWDNLSTKGLIHEMPDSVFVWNELQVREAVDLHGVPANRLVVTGAPRFDEFFALTPSVSREEFCRLVGFDAAEPIVLYLESSKFVAEREETFIQSWIERVRADARLSRANILVKPHPDLNRAWGDEGERVAWTGAAGEVKFRLSHPLPFPRVAVTRARFTSAQFLYDCLHQAAAVVGLNTSAELEAAIAGRPVLTIRAPEELVDGQESTLHFHYLLERQGGFVKTAETMPEHLDQLAAALAGEFDSDRTREFVRSFLRPSGLDRPATEVLVKAIERMPKRLAKQRDKAAAKEAARAAGPQPPAETTERKDEIVDLDYAPVPIRIWATSHAERQWRARSCAKEPWTVEWIERVIGTGSVLYDIGANVGTFTLVAARRQPTATVVAFEPGYASYAHLCDNLVLNHCQGNVIPVPLPLWSRNGMVAFKYRTVEPGQSRHGMKDRPPSRKPAGERGYYEQPVLATRLDDLVRQYELPLPTAIKLDVDGAEGAVLRGAAETLRSRSLTTLLVEFEEEQRAEVCSLLAAAGFTMVREIERSKPNAPNYAEFGRKATS
jgi:FkbM family methyltransferase